MKLTPKQEKFCILFVKYGDATKAYMEAYNCKNRVTARTNAHKNLQKPIIKARIEELMKGSKANSIASAEEVLEFLSRVVRGEEKDQFGLETSIADRTKAGELLLKRYRVFDRVDEKMEDLKRRETELNIKKKELEIEKMSGSDKNKSETLEVINKLKERVESDLND